MQLGLHARNFLRNVEFEMLRAFPLRGRLPGFLKSPHLREIRGGVDGGVVVGVDGVGGVLGLEGVVLDGY